MKLCIKTRSPAVMMLHLVLEARGQAYEVASLEGQGDSSLPAELNEVPALLHNDLCITQSMAIVEYLEELDRLDRKGPLYPECPSMRAAVRSFVHVLVCELQPWEDGRLSAWLGQQGILNDEQRNQWLLACLEDVFHRLEYRLAHQARTGTFCFGETMTLADLALLPQVVLARRAGLSMASYPHIERICDNCLELDWCREVLTL